MKNKIQKQNGFTQSQNETDMMVLESFVEEQNELAKASKKGRQKSSNGFSTTMSGKKPKSETQLETTVSKPVDVVVPDAVVAPEIVKKILKGFQDKPYSVIAKFIDEDGCLVMKLTMWFVGSETREFLIYTDTTFIGLVMRAMRGIEFEKWEEYTKEVHGIMATCVDPRIDIFRQFMNSELKRCINKDYIAPTGKTYACVSFIISSWNEIRFCLERTDEINEIMNATF
jgi:hypothetical protein